MANIYIIVEEERQYQTQHLRSLRRTLRDSENPLTTVTEARFVELYRFPKNLCVELIEELAPFMKHSSRSHAIPSFIKVLCALRFYATGSYQRSVGQDAMSFVSQTSISRCISEVTAALNHIAHQEIKFPSREEYTVLKANFYSKYGFPGVIGLIDGTHIKITAPSCEIEHVYYCRKGGHSKNVMIVCDADLLIRTASARFGGTAHDSYVWRQSKAFRTLKGQYDNGERNFHLLGDSGYPLQPWLMTPFSNTTTTAQERYNVAHKKTRCIVERCIGVLKGRFRCLHNERALAYKPAKAAYIIYAVMVLHNKLIRARVPVTEILNMEEEESNETAPDLSDILPAARSQRDRIVRDAFSS